MPPPSEAALRYAIIDRCLTNPYKPFPTMDVLKWEIERELKTSVLDSKSKNKKMLFLLFVL